MGIMARNDVFYFNINAIMAEQLGKAYRIVLNGVKTPIQPQHLGLATRPRCAMAQLRVARPSHTQASQITVDKN